MTALETGLSIVLAAVWTLGGMTTLLLQVVLDRAHGDGETTEPPALARLIIFVLWPVLVVLPMLSPATFLNWRAK